MTARWTCGKCGTTYESWGATTMAGEVMQRAAVDQYARQHVCPTTADITTSTVQINDPLDQAPTS